MSYSGNPSAPPYQGWPPAQGAPPPQGHNPNPNPNPYAQQYGQQPGAPYGSAQQPGAPYGSAPAPAPGYGQPPNPWGQTTPAPPYGGGPAPYPYPGAYGAPGASFPPGTDPEVVRMFQTADKDNSGSVDELELQKLLTKGAQAYSIRTVRLMLHLFSPQNPQRIAPPEFVKLWNALKEWGGIFQRFDRDYSGKIDGNELRDALLSMGYALPPAILKLVVSKYDRTGHGKAIDYDNFIECGLVVKGLTDKFKEKDTKLTGSATLSYEAFMLLVLPFVVA